jgi:ATP-binding cassette, subfamily B, bacterial PglK
MKYFQKLRLLLNKKTKSRLLWLATFSIFLSIVEVAGISSIMPFIDISTNFQTIQNNTYYQWLFIFFSFESEVNFVIVFGLVLFGFYIFRGGVNLLYSYMMANFTEKLYKQTTKRLFKTYLAMPYHIFTSKNSSYLTKTIVTEAALMSVVVRDVLIMLSEIFIVLFLYLLMLITSWKITLVFTIVLLIKMLFLTKKVSKKIKVVGEARAKSQAEFYELINRVIGNFEHVKLQDKDRLEDLSNNFSVKINEYGDSNATYNFLRDFPRIFIETGGFSLIILLLITLVYLNQSNVAYALPTLSLFVLALYRLLPSANRIIHGYNTLMYYHKSIDIIDEELKTPQENMANKSVEFTKSVELKNIGFSYQENSVLEDVSLIINKGDKVAFIGESGSGKSTLVNLIIGLHEPDKGSIQIDGIIVNESNLQNWRSQIGYISQQVYLFDGTIADNVCFGRSLNRELLNKVLKQANIFSFLQTKRGVETLVGEGGIQLSGGQKQRVAIARALYGQPEILVLDEATSSLDDQTEARIMNEIYNISQDRTLIIIAHRLSTIEGCDKVYKIKDGAIEQ